MKRFLAIVGFVLFFAAVVGAWGWLMVQVDIEQEAKDEIRHRAKFRQEAIDAGCAEWTIDAKTGEKQFKWLPAGEKHAD